MSSSDINKIQPRKLCPPPEMAHNMIEKDKKELPRNPVARFFAIFFGEGF